MEPLQQMEVDSCSICLELLASPDGGDLSRSPCNHPFHQHCLKEWFINGFPGSWCPLCKRPLHQVERFDALFGGGTSNDLLSTEEMDALLEQRAAEEFDRFVTAARHLSEARTNYNLAWQRNLAKLMHCHEDVDQLLDGYKRLSESKQWLKKDKMELDKAVKYLKESKRQGTSAQGQLVTPQVVARRQRKYDRDIKRYRQENQGIKILEKRHQEVRKQMEEDDKLNEEQGRNLEEETDRFELAQKRYKISELILMQ